MHFNFNVIIDAGLFSFTISLCEHFLTADDDDHDHLRKKQVLKEPMKLDLVKVKPEPRSEPKPEPRSEPKQKEESKSTPLHSRTSTPKVSTPPPQKKQKTNVSDLIESAFNKISETKRIDPIEPYALVKPKQQVTTVADILKMNDDLCVRVDFMGDFCLLKKIDESFGGFDGDVFHGVVVDSSKEDYFAKVKKEVEDEMGR